MANDSNGFFYWYKRYKVRAQDMTDFQDAMAETARGLGEGIMGAAILRGLPVTAVSGFSISVDSGIATAASGYLEVLNDSVNLDVSASVHASLPCRSLVVITPKLTDSDLINSPTVPFTQVPLRQLQQATIVLIPGTPGSSPEYPAKGPNDVILCGLIVPAGSTSISTSMIDFEVRETIGVNSLVVQNQVRFDNRLRPYRSAAKILGIKPSQNVGSAPMCFSYPGRLRPSLYPLNGGSFSPNDTFLDFATGVISGGDTTTPAFTPVIPTGNRSVIAVVTLTQTDTLNISYGDATGTYDQCFASIKNQFFSGTGSLPASDGNFGIAYVILTSVGGVLSDAQVFDGRPFLGSGASAAKFKNEVPSGTVNGSNTDFVLSERPADPESLIFWVNSNPLEKTDYIIIGGTVVRITNADMIPQLAQSVYVKYLVFGAVSNNAPPSLNAAKFRQEVPIGVVDGSNATFTLTSTPIDDESLDFWVNENHLEKTDYTITGTSVTITNPDFIPQLAQSVYVKYLYLGFIPGGGGGGTSGYTPFGNQSSPQVIGVSGITSTSEPLQTWFVRAPSGAVVVTANPQISPGSRIGDVMKIKVVDGANYPVFQDGNGLELNGSWPVTGQPSNVVQGSTIELSWGGLTWSEDSRR